MPDKKDTYVLPLLALERMRQMARSHGWVKKYNPLNLTKTEKTELPPIGDEVYVPSPGQEVGSGARPSRRDPKPFAVLMHRVMQDFQLDGRMSVADLHNRWEKIVGSRVAANCTIEKFDEKGVLTVAAQSSSWAAQLQMLSGELEKRIAQEIGEGTVKEIRIVGPSSAKRRYGRYVAGRKGFRSPGK